VTFPWPRALLTCGALLPYWRFLTFRVLYVTDDYFASDIFNGELPGRALIGQSIRSGEWPAWTTQLCSGLPLAGSPADALGLVAFTLLPPAQALDLYVIALLLIAAHGAYGLARRFGADATAAILAGLAFAGSGYIACQLKHLAIVATVVWLPIGMIAIDRASEADMGRDRRALWMAAFGLVYAQQVLAGFPQSAYICALVYGPFALFRTLHVRRQLPHPRAWQAILAGLGVAVALGAAAGAIVLLPLSKLGSVSDRAEDLGWDWATRLAYWPSNLIQFVFPYANGDISNNTYAGPPFFWEDYGYVGIATLVMAIYGGIRERKRPMVLFASAMTVLAMLFVLGRATPIYQVAYLLIPGLKMFRFPTRFLIVVELGLAILAAVGLTRLREDLQRRWPASALARIAPLAICAFTAVDLFVHQPRQNPIVPAREWLAAPRAVDVVHADTPNPRTFTPRHRDFHRDAFLRARGWTDVSPYFALREALPPNLGGAFWNTPSADCYAGISARWTTDVWGDHNREASLAAMLTSVDFPNRTLRVHPAFANVLRTYGVTHLLSPFPQTGAALSLLRVDPDVFVYRVEGSARARFVPDGRGIATEKDAVARLIDPAFDPSREVLLHDAPPPAAAVNGAITGGSATIVGEDARGIVVRVDAPRDGYLVLADTYYPGWSAAIDGQEAPVLRANIASRAVPVRQGRHDIRMTYEPPGLSVGRTITLVALALLSLWLIAATYALRVMKRA
jgi:hypothetical protein